MRRNKWISLLLAGVMVFSCGCGAKSEETIISANEQTEGDESDNHVVGQSNNGLGRYIEEDLTLPEELEGVAYTTKMADGSIRIANEMGMTFESKDNGVTWEQRSEDWQKKWGSTLYANAMAISPEGEYLLSYSISEEEEETEEDSNLSTEDIAYRPDYLYIAADGTQVPVNADFSNSEYDNNFICGMYFTPDDRALCRDLDGQIYEINKESGTLSKLFHAGGYVEGSTVTDKYFIALVDGKVKMYDLATNEEQPEDTVLNEFLSKSGNLSGGYNSSESAALFIQAENEDTIYVATRSGLYRHVIGGTVMEMLVDGTLSTFGTPSAGLISMFQVNQNEFLVFFTGSKLIHYTYDKTIKSVPDTELQVYGLKDNSTIRQAITQYQKENPDVYVKYNIGMPEDSGITREDALKNLNTEILAGTGPDVIVMDGISVDTYREKGMLADITPYLKPLEQELFSNIADTYAKDNVIYAVPAKFSVPFIAGKKDEISQIKDISSLEKMTSDLRAQNPEGAILGTISEKNLLQMMLSGCGTAFVTETGQIDQNALTGFLAAAKQIYINEGYEATEDDLSFYEEMEGETMAVQMGNHALQIPMGKEKLAYGYSNGIEFDYALLLSIFKTTPEYGFAPGNLGYGNIYYPSSVVSLSAASKQQEEAGKFITTLLSEPVQGVAFDDGFPVNKKGLETIFASHSEGEESGMLGMSTEDGGDFSVVVYWPDKEEQEQLYGFIDQLDTANTLDDTTKEIILDCGVDALNGTKEISVVVKEIMDKVNLRSAE